MTTFDSDNLIAIAAIFAVFISSISMIFAVIFGILQQKHNKNSVRPISMIRVHDAQNNIAVRIHNAGTGPLIIRRALFTSSTQTDSILLEMMPPIDQLWVTYTENIDGWTIPVNGSLTLIEIIPTSDRTRSVLRKALADIKVQIDYCDIYNTRFQDSRKLDFFGRYFKDTKLQIPYSHYLHTAPLQPTSPTRHHNISPVHLPGHSVPISPL